MRERRAHTLKHDHVARQVLEGNNGTLRGTILLQRDWNRTELGIVALIEQRRSGDIRQAVCLPHLD
ncbi:MAG: hypothetical protein ABI321_10955 [Polyangia bacterium]